MFMVDFRPEWAALTHCLRFARRNPHKPIDHKLLSGTGDSQSVYICIGLYLYRFIYVWENLDLKARSGSIGTRRMYAMGASEMDCNPIFQRDHSFGKQIQALSISMRGSYSLAFPQ